MSRQPWRTAKIRRPRAVVGFYVERLVSALHAGNPGQKLELHVAGSWRRGADPVGDIDIIVITESGDLIEDLLQPGVALPDFVRWDRSGQRVANGSIILPDQTELLVDVWGVQPAQRGAFLMFSTGPAQLNIAQRQRAVRGGMALSQIGLLDRRSKRQLDDGTERDIYRLLGWDWLEPEERQKWAQT